MPIRAGDVLKRASLVLNDEDFVRWEKAELFDWLNDAASEIVIRRPAARAVTGLLTLTAGSYQRLPQGGIELLDVISNEGGRSIRRTDRQLLDDAKPDWQQMRQASIIKHYTFDERTPDSFYVYPPAKAGTKLVALYSEAPPAVAAENDMVDLDRAYMGPLVSYILYRALAKDSEFANGQVAAAHLQAFMEAISVNNEVTTAVSPNAVSV